MEVEVSAQEQEFVRQGVAQAAALAAMLSTFYNALKEEDVPGGDAMRLTYMYARNLIGVSEDGDGEEVQDSTNDV